MKLLAGTVKTVVVVALVVAAFVAGLLVPFALKKWGPNSGWKQQYAYSFSWCPIFLTTATTRSS
jgi:hypothetical protein